MAESRKSQRVGCVPGRRYAINLADEDTAGRLVNFSRDGLAMRCSRHLQEEKLYQCAIDGYGLKDTVACQARIVWVSAQQDRRGRRTYGARIVRMAASDKIDLIETLHQDLTKSLTRKIKHIERKQ